MEGDSEVKLLGFWLSAFSHRVRWALDLKGVHYQYIEEYITQKKSQLLLDANPVHKKVPVLLHRGRTIAESIVILEYIDETWPDNPLMPADPYQRALARFWIQFGENMMGVFSSYLITSGEEQEKAAKECRGVLSLIQEKCLGNNKFFGGNEIGLIDLAFGWLAYCLDATEEAASGSKLMDGNTLPLLTTWAHSFKEVPAIKANLPDYAKLVAYLARLRDNKLVSS